MLIFDEILSGYRTGPDLIQGFYEVTPDLTTLGKAMGGGMPIAALAGKREFMESLAPHGPVIDSGTYYGQILVMAAAGAFLDIARDPAVWECQRRQEERFYGGMREIMTRHHAGHIQALGNRFSFHFGLEQESWEYRDWARRDTDLELRFFKAAFKYGVYFMRSPHHGFSWAHTEADLDEALNRIDAALGEAMK